MRKRSTTIESILRIHVVRERYRAVHILFSLGDQLHKSMFYFVVLYSPEKRLEYSFDVSFFEGTMTRFIKRYFVVLGACDREVQMFIVYLLSVVHVS